MATTRVHIIAKELGVSSKAIVDKCQAEGLDVKNHMAVISAGLAATIKEWFTEGSHETAVETSAPVDLKRVRVKKKKIAEIDEPHTELKADDVEEVKPEEEAPCQEFASNIDEQESAIEEPVEIAIEEIATDEIEQGADEEVSDALIEDEEPVSQVEQTPAVAIYEPPKLDATPAGPMLEKPNPAKLSGPRVVRVEQPEKYVPSRPRSAMSGSRPPFRPRPQATPAPAPAAAVDDSHKLSNKPKKGKTKKEELEEEKLARHAKKLRDRDMEERRARIEAAGGTGFRVKPSRKLASKKAGEAAEHKIQTKAVVSEPIIVKDLSFAMGVKISEIITCLFKQGTMVTANHIISKETAELLAIEFGVELSVVEKQLLEDEIANQFRDRARNTLTKRPVIVTMLGHVDHGKTSLLDRIRKSKVAQGEAGGITQHVGAYQIEWGDKKVTFLDTPGHEAFTAMRARGANMTDVVVLVVAADDGIMPQTVEAINHAKAAGVTIIVALNKIDLPGTDVNRIYGQLSEHQLVPSEWGGNVEVVKTSAVTGQGVDELLEYLDYTTELLELKSDNTIPAMGWVVEAKMTPSQGPVATLLLKEGHLKKGDIILAGEAYGRIRSLKNSLGKSISTAVSSMPVEISGLDNVPQAGDKFYCLDDINKAKAAAEEKAQKSREKSLVKRQHITLDNLFSQIAAGSIKELNVIVRADVQGSVDVLVKYLTDLSTDEVRVKILQAAPGGVTEGDVILAKASEAIIIGFNVVADDFVRRMAEEEGVDMRFYTIIYRITEDLKKAMSGLLEPEEQEKLLGRLVIRNTFKVTGVGTIAGCFVSSGVVGRNSKIRLIRNNIIIKNNAVIDSLKHFKDDAREVKAGFECGLKITGYDDVKTDDVIEAYEIVKVARSL